MAIENTSDTPPTHFGVVTANAAFVNSDGETVKSARGLWASADGTIAILLADGTAMASKMVFKGTNIFRLSKVTNLGSLTLEWFESCASDLPSACIPPTP